jgi:hypothetical protein
MRPLFLVLISILICLGACRSPSQSDKKNKDSILLKTDSGENLSDSTAIDDRRVYYGSKSTYESRLSTFKSKSSLDFLADSKISLAFDAGMSYSGAMAVTACRNQLLCGIHCSLHRHSLPLSFILKAMPEPFAVSPEMPFEMPPLPEPCPYIEAI